GLSLVGTGAGLSVSGFSTLRFGGNPSKVTGGGVPINPLRIGGTVGKTYAVQIGGWIQGVMDHCFEDFPVGPESGENIDTSTGTSPTGATFPSPYNGKGTATMGNWSLFQPYVYGGGPVTNGLNDAF